MDQQGAINDEQNDILYREQFFDDLIPDFSQYFDHDLDRYKERYTKLYEDCDDEQIVVERLNTQLPKIQIDDYMDDEMPQTSKQIMGFFVNYIINYLRIIVDRERQENLSYFIFYENKQTSPLLDQQMDGFKVIEEIQSVLLQMPEQKFKSWIFQKRRDIKFKRYLTQIFHINDKWMIQIYNILSEVVYFYSFQQENTDQSIFLQYLDQYLTKPFNEKNIYVYQQNLNRQGDYGDVVFWVCFKQFVQNISAVQGKLYFTKREIEALRPRIIWLFLRVSNTKVKKLEIPTVLIDVQEEQQEKLRQAKQLIRTQLEAEKKEEKLRKFAELVAQEQAEQERLKQIQIDELAEKEHNELMRGKVAKFNVRIPGSKRKSQFEAWLVGKVALPADHHHYNLTVDVPILHRQRIYMRDKSIISGEQQYKSMVDRPLILNLPPNGSNVQFHHQNMLPSIVVKNNEVPEDLLRQKWINAQQSKYDRGEPILPKKYYEEPYEEDRRRIRSNYPKEAKQEKQRIQQKSKVEQLQRGIMAMEQSIQQYQVNEQQLNELMKQNYQYSQSARFLPKIQ